MSRLVAEQQAILDAIADGLLIYDETGQIRRMNRAAGGPAWSRPGEGLTVGELAGRLRARRPDGRPLRLGELPALGALQGETVQGSLLVLQRPDATLWVSAAPPQSPAPTAPRRGSSLP